MFWINLIKNRAKIRQENYENISKPRKIKVESAMRLKTKRTKGKKRGCEKGDLKNKFKDIKECRREKIIV